MKIRDITTFIILYTMSMTLTLTSARIRGRSIKKRVSQKHNTSRIRELESEGGVADVIHVRDHKTITDEDLELEIFDNLTGETTKTGSSTKSHVEGGASVSKTGKGLTVKKSTRGTRLTVKSKKGAGLTVKTIKSKKDTGLTVKTIKSKKDTGLTVKTIKSKKDTGLTVKTIKSKKDTGLTVKTIKSKKDTGLTVKTIKSTKGTGLTVKTIKSTKSSKEPLFDDDLTDFLLAPVFAPDEEEPEGQEYKNLTYSNEYGYNCTDPFTEGCGHGDYMKNENEHAND